MFQNNIIKYDNISKVKIRISTVLYGCIPNKFTNILDNYHVS